MSASSSLSCHCWTCDYCTYLNHDSSLSCEMCYHTRVSTKDLSVTWQWQADVDQWIPYDLPSTNQIEEAYQQGDKSVLLTEGWFVENPGYSIQFHRASGNHHHQINHNSRTQRRARRVANDELDLYITVKAEELNADDRCGMCQTEFLGCTEVAADESKQGQSSTSSTLCDSTAASACASASSSAEVPQPDRIVRLRHCLPGHSFHHSCIAAWIKVKDQCPYCHARL